MYPRHRRKDQLASILQPWLVAAIFSTTVGCVSTPTALEGAADGASAWVKNLGDSVPLLSGSGATPVDRPAGSADAELGLTPAETRMRHRSHAFQRTVWEGVLIGAGTGALWGTLAGDDTEGILTKTAIGGAVGGLAGAYVANKQREFASAEDQLDSMIADVRQSNRDAEALIASIQEVLAEDRRRIAVTEQRYQAGQATQAELAATRSRATANRAIARDAVEGAREQHAMFSEAQKNYREDNPGISTNELERELKAYRAQIEALDDLAESISVA